MYYTFFQRSPMRVQRSLRLPSSVSRLPFLNLPSYFLLLSLFLSGCGSGANIFTHDIRVGRTLKDLRELQFFVSAAVELVSLKKGEMVGEPPFLIEKKKRLFVPKDLPGRIVTADELWLVIDFGQGILLTFRLADTGAYVMPSWGTITLGGERFDVQMGVLAGPPIVLCYQTAPLTTE